MRTTAEELRKELLTADLGEAEVGSKSASAVLILLRPAGNGLEVLLGQRAQWRGDPWSGQISFPGGHHHREDGSLLETALRETREEANLDLRGLADVLGHLAPRSPRVFPGLFIVPFVALASGPLDPRPGPEMVEMFWVPLAELPPSEARTVVATRIGDLKVPAFLWRGRVIWGLTFRILEELLELVGIGR